MGYVCVGEKARTGEENVNSALTLIMGRLPVGLTKLPVTYTEGLGHCHPASKYPHKPLCGQCRGQPGMEHGGD
jgi:hypothetical protein